MSSKKVPGRKPKKPLRHKAVPLPTPLYASDDVLGEDLEEEITPEDLETFDIESEMEDPETLLKYPPPRRTPVYSQRWAESIPSIVKRTNFRVGHLAQLDILCRLYEEELLLSAFVEKNGISYASDGRNGTQFKQYPESLQLNRVRTEIRNFSKTLGLLLVKDESMTGADKGPDSWD